MPVGDSEFIANLTDTYHLFLFALSTLLSLQECTQLPQPKACEDSTHRIEGCLTGDCWEGVFPLQEIVQEREALTISTGWLHVAVLGSGSLGHCLLTVAQSQGHIYPHSISGEAAQPLLTD